jgi:hypothetical protein
MIIDQSFCPLFDKIEERNLLSAPIHEKADESLKIDEKFSASCG